MKKKIFVFFLILSIVYQYGVKLPQKRYLREETVMRHLKKDPFLKKPLSSWMIKQIEEDLNLSKDLSVSAVKNCFMELDPWVVHYRVVQNQLYRYVPEGRELPSQDTHTEKAIKTLAYMQKLPDMDFLVSYLDAYPLDWILPESLKAPVLVSGKIKGALNGILIPDERSIGPWWLGELRMIEKNRISWSQKKKSAFWRGGFTKPIRRELCRISLKHPEDLDARFVLPTEEGKSLEEEGLVGQRCNWIDLLNYRYLPLVDGVMCAWPAFQGRLFSQSLTFKPDSEEVQWFYSALVPGVHYVPVSKDLSDLIEKIEWARRSDEACFEIAENAYAFAKENLMFEGVMNYFLGVLTGYGKRQQADRHMLKKEVEKDPSWVNIQRRKGIFKK